MDTRGVAAVVPTLYDADKDRALTLIAAMIEPQCLRQALAYAA